MSEKTFHLDLDSRPNYLYARVTGPNTAEAIRGYLNQIFEACEQFHRPNVLIEESLEGPSLSMAEIFAIVKEQTDQARGVLGRIAFIDTNPAHDAMLMRFAETVAVNRGVCVRIFGSVAAAAEWLEAPAKAPTG